MALTEPPVPSVEEIQRADDGRRRAIFGLVGGFLAVLVIIVTVQWITDNDDPSGTGEPLPDLVFTTLDGEDFAITTIVGQPTVVNFFASWVIFTKCMPCIVMPIA